MMFCEQDAVAQTKYRVDDPIASIDGEPIFLGELNLVLHDRLKIRDVSKAPVQVQQAIAATLVRQHLAMKSLRSQGGKSLEQLIDRHIGSLEQELRRRRTDLQEHAKLRSSNEDSLRASMAWEVAWRRYLKSRMTDKNLATYFSRNKAKYGGGRWDVSQIFLKTDLADQASVAAVSQRLQDLITEIRASSDPEISFAQAARQHSEDSSAANGGRVGWVEKDGDLPSSVMSAVRAMETQTSSDVIRSPNGLHVVWVHDRQTSDLEFEDLVDQARLRRDASDALFHQLVRQQKDAKISWYIPALKPPQSVSLIPKD
jgi:peptidyl-prolyl cis-trans isomerase C